LIGNLRIKLQPQQHRHNNDKSADEKDQQRSESDSETEEGDDKNEEEKVEDTPIVITRSPTPDSATLGLGIPRPSSPAESRIRLEEMAAYRKSLDEQKMKKFLQPVRHLLSKEGEKEIFSSSPRLSRSRSGSVALPNGSPIVMRRRVLLQPFVSC
jgi:hypothetical protein